MQWNLGDSWQIGQWCKHGHHYNNGCKQCSLTWTDTQHVHAWHTVRVRIFAGYKLSRLSQIVLNPWNLILGYICTHDLKIYMCLHLWDYTACSCMSTENDNNLDHILGRQVSDELVVMMESSQLTTWLLAEPARCRTSSHKQSWWHGRPAIPRRQDRGTAGRRPFARRHTYLSLMRYLCHINALLITWKTHIPYCLE